MYAQRLKSSQEQALEHLKTTTSFLRVERTARTTLDQALANVPPQQGPALMTLLRTNHHLSHVENLDELLQSILTDAVSALQAQRGSIILASASSGPLKLRAVHAPKLPATIARLYSRTLAERCVEQQESLLCRDIAIDEALMQSRSIRQGTMSSIICALLRTPRRCLGVMQLDRGPFQESFQEGDLFLADALAASVAFGIESAQLVEEQRDQFVQTVISLARTVECRDQYTADHTQRVTDYALLLGEELKLSPVEKYQIQVGTPLHDIGKIGIDDSILRKPGKLTAAEFEAMKTHTVKGVAILENLANLYPMMPIVRHHHERWDGQGYPDRLGGTEISLTARVVAVADAFDAMTSHRPYRAALPSGHAFLELIRGAGTHFDPECVKAFLRLRPRIESILQTSPSK